MAKELKQIICEELRGRFTQLDGCVLIDHRGLDSEQTQDLRCTLREKGVQMNVVPNRLAKRVLLDLGAPSDFCDLIRGPTAILFGGEGAFVASKSIMNWRRKNKDLAEIRGGMFEGETLSPDDVKRLADIPEPEVLRSTIAGMFVAPMTHLASCAKSLTSHFAGCVEAKADSGSGSSEAEAEAEDGAGSSRASRNED